MPWMIIVNAILGQAAKARAIKAQKSLSSQLSQQPQIFNQDYNTQMSGNFAKFLTGEQTQDLPEEKLYY